LSLEEGTRPLTGFVGYFFTDPVDSKPGAPVFNRTVTLKDGWVKK
jgi:glutaminyl-tRNA synthetase